MKKLLLAAAATCVFAGSAMAQVELNIGGHDHDGYRDHDRRVIVREHRRCENVTVRRHRPNGTVVVTHERRCR